MSMSASAWAINWVTACFSEPRHVSQPNALTGTARETPTARPFTGSQGRPRIARLVILPGIRRCVPISILSILETADIREAQAERSITDCLAFSDADHIAR